MNKNKPLDKAIPKKNNNLFHVMTSRLHLEINPSLPHGTKDNLLKIRK